MALIAVASAKGSPGVTTLSVALAALMPGPCVVADLDPAGGDLALSLRDPAGGPLDAERGLLSLGAAVRRATHSATLDDHLQDVAGGLRVLCGVPSPEQTAGMGPVWHAIATALRVPVTDGRHVIADCGRVVPGSPTLAVLEAADAVLLVARPTLWGLYHLRERLRALQSALRSSALRSSATRIKGSDVPLGVVLVGKAGDRSTRADVMRLLASSGLTVAFVAVVADEPKAAAGLLTGDGRLGRSDFIRSVHGLVPLVADLATGAGSTGADAELAAL